GPGFRGPNLAAPVIHVTMACSRGRQRHAVFCARLPIIVFPYSSPAAALPTKNMEYFEALVAGLIADLQQIEIAHGAAGLLFSERGALVGALAVGKRVRMYSFALSGGSRTLPGPLRTKKSPSGAPSIPFHFRNT